MARSLAQLLGGIERRRDDRHVAGAAAQMSAEEFAQLRFGRDRACRADSSRATSGCPAVQKPHCSAWWRRNASCSTDSRPGSGARPSTVRIVAPSACTASVRQARAGAPSISTVQAPQTPCSQPTCVPVSAELVAQEVGEQHARLGLALDRAAVERRSGRGGARRRSGAASTRLLDGLRGRAGAPARGDSRRWRAGRRARSSSTAKSSSASSSASPSSVPEIARGRHGRQRRRPRAGLRPRRATAAQATMAKSPWRRANSRNA